MKHFSSNFVGLCSQSADVILGLGGCELDALEGMLPQPAS
jgi:hypothetical protein